MNIYTVARNRAGYTQEAAAQKLGMRKSTLSGIEQGKRFPAAIQISDMVRVYGAEELQTYYCSHECPCGPMLPLMLDTPQKIASALSSALETDIVGSVREALAEKETQWDHLYEMYRELRKISSAAHSLKIWYYVNEDSPYPKATLRTAEGETEGYVQARIRVNMRVQEACDQAGINRSTLYRIEKEENAPSLSLLQTLSVIYRAPELENYFCEKSCDLGRPPLYFGSDELGEIITLLLLAAYCSRGMGADLKEMLADGAINDAEEEQAIKILAILEEYIYVTDCLLLWLRKQLYLKIDQMLEDDTVSNEERPRLNEIIKQLEELGEASEKLKKLRML